MEINNLCVCRTRPNLKSKNISVYQQVFVDILLVLDLFKSFNPLGLSKYNCFMTTKLLFDICVKINVISRQVKCKIIKMI